MSFHVLSYFRGVLSDVTVTPHLSVMSLVVCFAGQNESKSVLDAFFLGKALAEALSERIESTVGEFLSTVGRVQAEQQKQVQEFQDEVLERAKRAKEVAAREAMEAQGIIPKSSTVEMSTNGNGVPETSSSALKAASPEYVPPAVSSVQPSSTDVNDRGVPIED
ncbi:hypothetical protein Leryth_000834 [Lithospermum erythrorhizon]|nr:hypothetical protein Leryth_000834 [Lithospermum erythrorhizon]